MVDSQDPALWDRILAVAIPACEEGARNADEIGDAAVVARFLYWQGLGYQLEKNEETAAVAFHTSLKLWRPFVQSDGNLARSEVAAAALLQASLQANAGKPTVALELALEAEGHYRLLLESGETRFEVPWLGAANTVAACHIQTNHWASAVAIMEMSVPRLRNATKSGHPQLFPNLGDALNNYGMALGRMHRVAEAEKALAEGVAIFRRLSHDRAAQHEPSLALILSSHSTALSALFRFNDCIKASEEAVAIHRKLAVADPSRYRYELVTTLANYSGALRAAGRLEEAEETAQEAVTIARTGSGSPTSIQRARLASALYNRAVCLRQLGRTGESINLLEEALKIRRSLYGVRPAQFRAVVAFTMASLGTAWSDLGQHDSALALLEEAVTHYRVLAEENSDAFELPLATTLGSLAGVRADKNLSVEAEADYREMLSIRERRCCTASTGDREAVSVALTNLATILIVSKRYQEAEQIVRRAISLLPESSFAILFTAWSRLGTLYFAQNRLHEAEKALTESLRHGELHRAGVLTVSHREKLLREAMDAYDLLVVCRVRDLKVASALEAVEQGKGRSLADLMNLGDLQPQHATEALTKEYGQLVLRLRARVDQSQLTSAEDPERMNPSSDSTNDVRRLRKVLEELQASDPEFVPTAKPLSASEIASTARRSGSVLVLFRVTHSGTFTILVFPDGAAKVLETAKLTVSSLSYFLLAQPEGSHPNGWLRAYYATLDTDRSKRASASGTWDETIDARLGEMGRLLMEPVSRAIEAWCSNNPKCAGRRVSLVLLPSRGLALLPLHACWWGEERRRYLLDDYVIQYSPSVATFSRCFDRSNRSGKDRRLVAIGNPVPGGEGDELPMAEWECLQLRRMWTIGDVKLLCQVDASMSNVKRHIGTGSVIHFACHGQYSFDAPLLSHLQLADSTPLTLSSMLTEVSLPHAKLVTLSACETGFVDFREPADEHFGLPIAFLNAGAAAVICSLWSVDDRATSLLMYRMYELMAQGISKRSALRAAQLWLRDVTLGELKKHFPPSAGPQVVDLLETLESEIGDPTVPPFRSPYWWAAFQMVGA